MQQLKTKKSVFELERKDLSEIKNSDKYPIIVVLDNVRSSHNVGSFFRTCDAFLVEKLVLCGITPYPPNPEINKTALGSTETVTWEYYETTEAAINNFKKNGYLICCVEQVHGSINFDELRIAENKKKVIVFGHEVYGISQNIIDLSDYCIEIEQKGTKHSLNVSVCGGIVLHELIKN